MAENMDEELAVMMQLQRKDLELKRLLETKDAIPSLIKEKDRRLEDEKRKVSEVQEELRALMKKRRSLETDVSALEEKVKGKQAQLLKVSNNKEYQALLHEIKNTSELQSKTEVELLKMMEEEDRLADEVRMVEEALGPAANAIEREKEELKKELKHQEDLIPAVKKAREGIAARLGPGLLSRYERIAKGKAGLAVVALRKGACGGCFTALPPQTLNEVKRNNRLITCEHCGRVLVWDESNDGDSS